MSKYLDAKKLYQSFGIDTDKVIETLKRIPISIHCWQGDDVRGFESGNQALTGGIQATGNYPGRARNFKELSSDLETAFKHIPGSKRLNLHAIYAVTDKKVERDQITTKHFDPWLDFAVRNKIKLDFNPTFFSSPRVKDNFTLSSPDDDTRNYWIKHGINSRKIAAYIGEKQQSPCLFNVWIPDGMKDTPADRFGPRLRLKDSLDKIFAEPIKDDVIIDAVESKVFGIGLESFTVGSQEFYLNYAQQKGICCLIDSGHYHPTENVADKLSSMLIFNKYVALHVTRPVRWDSDHVVLYDDITKDIAREIIQSKQPERFLIGLDYFDASINRIAAWVLGTRNFQKALLSALLKPYDKMKALQDSADFTRLLVLGEELKTLPFDAIWEEYCKQENVSPHMSWYDDVLIYEKDVLIKRK